METIKKEKGSKYNFVKREWLNERDYIDYFRYKRVSYFRLESDERIYFSIKMKKKKKVQNNGFFITEDYTYKIQLDKNLITLNKNSINNYYFLNVLVRNSIVNVDYMKNYLSKLISNTFFEKDLSNWLNNSSSSLE